MSVKKRKSVRKSPIIVSTPSGTQSNFWSTNTTLLPIARRVMATTVSSSMVGVKPMSKPSSTYTYMDDTGYQFSVCYSNGLFVVVNKSTTSEVYKIYVTDWYYEKSYIVKVMNENKSSVALESLIEDEGLRNQIISILRKIKIKKLINDIDK
jgi:hypothetical protein